MKPKYDPKLPLRCALTYSVSYMQLPNNRVRMCVGRFPRRDKKIDGDGRVFDTIEKAREYAYNRGYIIYDEELSEKTLNKNE